MEEQPFEFSLILTENSAMKEIIRMAKRAAPSDVTILMTGESGTGKNVLSESIHRASKRSLGPFLPVNCLAIPETLIESELFGHEKGAFTDAYAQRKGCFESAEGGTLYLEEIGDMSQIAQGKILEAVEEKRFKRVGGEHFIDSNVRIIAATNQNLLEKMKQGHFRDDLYYRLKGVSFYLPPLRERREDIPVFIRHFAKFFGVRYGKPDLVISDAAMNQLMRYDWPGNIRELKNVVESAVIMCGEPALWLEHFPFELRLKTGFQKSSASCVSVDTVLRQHVFDTLQSCQWNKKQAALLLGISRPRLDRCIKKFRLAR